jgi:hypothetical protein
MWYDNLKLHICRIFLGKSFFPGKNRSDPARLR